MLEAKSGVKEVKRESSGATTVQRLTGAFKSRPIFCRILSMVI